MDSFFKKIKNLEISDNPDNLNSKKINEAISKALETWEEEFEGKNEFEKFSWVRGFVWGYLYSEK